MFASDSWIPTAQSSAAISCKAASGNIATTTQCGASADFNAGSNNCFGCMDSQDIMSTYASAATFSANIQTRYPGAGCVQFINQLTNTFNNYYNIKNVKYNPLKTRSTTAATAINVYKTSITNVGTAFDSVISSFETTADSIFDPTYGIIAGLNCAIVG